MVHPKGGSIRSEDPPADLNSRNLPLLKLDGQFLRIHETKFSPIFFGRTGRHRFDHPNPARPEFGTLYAAADEFGAFIESFGDSAGNTVSLSTLSERSVAKIGLGDPINVVDITGAGAAWLGAAGEVSAGQHSLSQRWAQALWQHPQSPEGIFYRARHDLSRNCVAIFDRPKAVSITVISTTPLLHPSLKKQLGEILELYRFALV